MKLKQLNSIAFIGDTSNRENWGCRATTKALLSQVQPYSHSVSTWDIREVTEAFWNYQPGRRVRDRILARFSKPISGDLERSLTLENIDNVAAALKQVCPELWSNLSDADAIVVNGEGSFLQRRIPGRLKLAIAYAAKTALNKPVVICNHSADVRDPVMMDMAKCVYPLVDDVLVREHFSFDLLSSTMQLGSIEFAADCVFRYSPDSTDAWKNCDSQRCFVGDDPDHARPVDLSKPYICVGGSSAYLASPEIDYDHRKVFYDLCRALMEIAPVVLTAAGAPENTVFRDVGADLKIPMLGTSTGTQRAVDILGNASCYVGGRWHPAIMALTGCTPLIMFSANTKFKSEGLCRLIGSEHPVVSSFEINENQDSVVELARNIVINQAEFARQLRPKIDSLKTSALHNVRLIEQLAAKS